MNDYSDYVTDDPSLNVTDNRDLDLKVYQDSSSHPPVGLYVGVSVAVLFLLIILSVLIIVVAVVKKKQGKAINRDCIMILI